MGKPTSADRCRAPPILKKIINSNEPGECVCECVWRGIFSYSLQVQNNNTAKVFSRALKYPARHAYHQFDFLFIRFDTVTGYTAHTKTVTRQEQNKKIFILKGGGGGGDTTKTKSIKTIIIKKVKTNKSFAHQK